MSKKTKAKAGLKGVAELKSLDPTRELGLPVEKKKLARKAKAAKNYLGRVNYVGRGNGKRIVGLQTDDKFYSGVWPSWAYELAKIALVNQRKLSVWSRGRPTGANLAAVYVTILDA